MASREIATFAFPSVVARVVRALATTMASLVLCAAVPQAIAKDDPHAAHRRAMQQTITTDETRITLPNVTLRDAYGRPFALKPSSFDGKIVVVNFIFTRCTSICPALTSVMSAVQRGLGPRLGRDVVLLSISVDPGNDTTKDMRAYAERVGASVHWRWLTGNSGDIARVLRAFGLSAGKPGDHPPLVLVGDPARNRWTRWVGVPTPATIVDTARKMADTAGVDTASTHAKDAHAAQ